MLQLRSKDDRLIFNIDRDKITLGRSDECDIVLSTSRSISKKHIIFHLKKDSYGEVVIQMEDLNSRNGFFVNKEHKIGGSLVTLEHGDIIRFGYDELEFFVSMGEQADGEAVVDFGDIGEISSNDNSKPEPVANDVKEQLRRNHDDDTDMNAYPSRSGQSRAPHTQPAVLLNIETRPNDSDDKPINIIKPQSSKSRNLSNSVASDHVIENVNTQSRTRSPVARPSLTNAFDTTDKQRELQSDLSDNVPVYDEANFKPQVYTQAQVNINSAPLAVSPKPSRNNTTRESQLSAKNDTSVNDAKIAQFAAEINALKKAQVSSLAKNKAVFLLGLTLHSANTRNLRRAFVKLAHTLENATETALQLANENRIVTESKHIDEKSSRMLERTMLRLCRRNFDCWRHNTQLSRVHKAADEHENENDRQRSMNADLLEELRVSEQSNVLKDLNLLMHRHVQRHLHKCISIWKRNTLLGVIADRSNTNQSTSERLATAFWEKLQLQKLFRVWRSWSKLVIVRHEKQFKVLSLLKKKYDHVMKRGMRNWKRHTRESRLEDRLADFGIRGNRRALVGAFRQWRAKVKHSVRTRACVDLVLGQQKKVILKNAFTAWRHTPNSDNTTHSREMAISSSPQVETPVTQPVSISDSNADEVKSLMSAMQRQRAFYQWQRVASQHALGARLLMERTLRVMRKLALATAMNEWTGRAKQGIRYDTFCLRKRTALTLSVFKAWREQAQKQHHHVRAFNALCRKSENRILRNALAAWKLRTHRARIVCALVRRRATRSMRQAFSKWIWRVGSQVKPMARTRATISGSKQNRTTILLEKVLNHLSKRWLILGWRKWERFTLANRGEAKAMMNTKQYLQMLLQKSKTIDQDLANMQKFGFADPDLNGDGDGAFTNVKVKLAATNAIREMIREGQAEALALRDQTTGSEDIFRNMELQQDECMADIGGDTLGNTMFTDASFPQTEPFGDQDVPREEDSMSEAQLTLRRIVDSNDLAKTIMEQQSCIFSLQREIEKLNSINSSKNETLAAVLGTSSLSGSSNQQSEHSKNALLRHLEEIDRQGQLIEFMKATYLKQQEKSSSNMARLEHEKEGLQAEIAKIQRDTETQQKTFEHELLKSERRIEKLNALWVTKCTGNPNPDHAIEVLHAQIRALRRSDAKTKSKLSIVMENYMKLNAERKQLSKPELETQKLLAQVQSLQAQIRDLTIRGGPEIVLAKERELDILMKYLTTTSKQDAFPVGTGARYAKHLKKNKQFLPIVE